MIHRRARVKEEYRRRVSPVADAVVDSVVEVPAGRLEVLAALETHQRTVEDGEPAQQRALGDVHSRPPADARDRGRPEFGGKVRMERRSFRRGGEDQTSVLLHQRCQNLGASESFRAG